jgi:hypothetical protein
VTPGAIVVGAIAFGLNLEVYKEKSIYIWILLFGLFYIVGIGLQYAREHVSGLEFPPVTYHNNYRYLNLKNNPDIKGDSKPVDKNNLYEREFGCDDIFRNSKYYAEFRLPFIKKLNRLKNGLLKQNEKSKKDL